MASPMNPKAKRLSANDKRRINNAGRLNLIQDIQEIETRAHDLGMYVTAHALNNAKNTLGWEIAGNINVAGIAAKGQRVGDGGNR